MTDRAQQLHEATRGYLRRGWFPVPIPPRTKRAVLKGWPELRLKEADLPKHFGPEANVGLILGEPSGWLIDVDLDCPEAIELADNLLPPTAAVTGRTGAPRSHRWYIAEGAETAKHTDPKSGKMIVELRSTGLQTVVGPSVHPDGDLYDTLNESPAKVSASMLALCVKGLADAVVEKRHGSVLAEHKPVLAKPVAATEADDFDVERRAIAYLEKMEPAVSGSGGHRHTYTAAVCLVHGFALNTEHALRLLLNYYNPRCQPAWSEKELRHKVDDAASKQHDKPRGWLRDQRLEDLDAGVDLSKFVLQTSADEPIADVGPADPGPFPIELLTVPGLISQVTKHAVETAYRRQPVLALGAAIALLGTLTGRKVMDDLGTRTNIYCLGICPSGGGKDRAREVNKEILFLAGAQDLIGPEGLASHAGLVSVVEQRPAILLQLDEIGRLLRTIGEPARSPHLYHIATNLMKLYTSSGSVYVGDGYSDIKRNTAINQPCACVYGTTVPQSFYEGLSSESISDGFLSRVMIFEAEKVPKVRPPKQTIPESVIETARRWHEFKPGGNLTGEHPTPLEVDATSDAISLFDKLDNDGDSESDKLGEPLGTLWTRATEKARKLALIYACSANLESPLVDRHAADWGCQLSRYLTERMIYLAGQWIAENPYDAKRKRVLRAITAAGEEGLTRTKLYHKTKAFTIRERTEIVDALILCGDIVFISEPSGGAPRGRYVATQFVRGTY